MHDHRRGIHFLDPPHLQSHPIIKISPSNNAIPTTPNSLPLSLSPF